MKSFVFIFCTLVVGARTYFRHSIDRTALHNFNGLQNSTATVSLPSPGTSFHNQTEHAQAYSLDLKVMMGVNEKELFDNMLSKGSVYFEFGLGGSTLFAAKHANLNHITAVDSSAAWIMKVKSQALIAADIQRGRISIGHVDLGPVGPYGYPIHRNTAKEREYSRAIIGTTRVPDVVLVDGRYRVACALRTALEAVENGWPSLILMIHDYERHEYIVDMNAVLGAPTHLRGTNGRQLAAWELTGAKLRTMQSDLGLIRMRLEQSELTPIFVSGDEGLRQNVSML
jgi:hypothetical protein